ncbi:MAG: hypothetical protein ACPG4U_09025 [Pseudomonadales bacterium]
MQSTIEVVTFNLKPGITAEQLAATNDAMQTFLLAQDGFLYRSTSCDDEGLWFDIIYWRDRAAAKAGGEAFMASDIGAQVMGMVEEASCKLRHMDAVSETLNCEDKAA